VHTFFRGGRLLGVSVFVLPDELETSAVATRSEHAVKIKAVSNGCGCEDQDAAGHGRPTDETTAPLGDWVVWENTMKEAVTLDFEPGRAKTPFNVRKEVVKAGTKLGLQVSPEAQIGRHPYVANVGSGRVKARTPSPAAGPVIIVPPPPPPPRRRGRARPKRRRSR
jgi:hypothetical protein